MSQKAVIFDMDGVIFNSEQEIINCWLELAEEYDCLHDIETPCHAVLGVNSTVGRQIFLDFYGADFPYEFFRGKMWELYHARFDGGRLPLKKGVRELLCSLQKNGFHIALASSTRSAIVIPQLRDAGLLDYFEQIICGDMVTRSKPDPDIFLKAAAEMNVEPRTTYVIEDSHNGIRAAHAAGMIPIMVPDLLPATPEMQEKAQYIMQDLLEVRTLLCPEK